MIVDTKYRPIKSKTFDSLDELNGWIAEQKDISMKSDVNVRYIEPVDVVNLQQVMSIIFPGKIEIVLFYIGGE